MHPTPNPALLAVIAAAALCAAGCVRDLDVPDPGAGGSGGAMPEETADAEPELDGAPIDDAEMSRDGEPDHGDRTCQGCDPCVCAHGVRVRAPSFCGPADEIPDDLCDCERVCAEAGESGRLEVGPQPVFQHETIREGCTPDGTQGILLRLGTDDSSCDLDVAPPGQLSLIIAAPYPPAIPTVGEIGVDMVGDYNRTGVGPIHDVVSGTVTLDAWHGDGAAGGSYDLTFADGTRFEGRFDAISCQLGADRCPDAP